MGPDQGIKGSADVLKVSCFLDLEPGYLEVDVQVCGVLWAAE